MTRMLFVFAMFLLAPLPLFAQAEQWPVTARGDWTADTRQWWSDDGERRIQLNMRTDGDGRWGSGVRISELDGFPPSAESGLANDVRFSWTREAGVFRFQGSFDRGRGNGTFTFAANPAYVSGMAALGHRNLTSDALLRLALIDVTQAYTRGLRDVGYSSIPLDDLIRMRIHRVSAEEIRELKALSYNGLATDDLVKFRIHKVTPQFIRSIHEAGFRTISIDQLVKMRIHKVDAQFIKDLQADGYKNLTAGDVIDLAIRGPRYARVKRPLGMS